MAIDNPDFKRYAIFGKLREMRGQMTVELCVVLPVAMIVALIGINAMSFFSTCASFDRQAKEAIRLVATSPSNSVDDASLAANVKTRLQDVFSDSNLAISVSVAGAGSDLRTFTATVEYSPTLFGLPMRGSFFGVKLPPLTHNATLSVEVYRVGSSLLNVA